MKSNLFKSSLMGLLALGYFSTAQAEFTDFTIDLTQDPVAELPAGVTQFSYPQNGVSYNGNQHGWQWYAIQFDVDGPVDITLGGCMYVNDGYEGYLEVNGTKVSDIKTHTADCWHNDKANNVGRYSYTGEAATLKLYCGQYCPFVEVKKAAAATNSFNNVASTITWAVGNEQEPTLSEGIADAVSTTKISVGTDLQVTSTTTTYTFAAEGSKGPYCTYQPSTSNPGCVTTDMVEYTIQVKKGLTFTPTSISFDAVKEATDGAFFSWSYTVNDVESAISKYSDPKTQIRRNNDANPSAPVSHQETISNAKGGQKVTLRFYISDVANNKKMSIGNVKINGIINGTIAQRNFKAFAVDFRSNPYTVTTPATGLPEGIAISGTWHDGQHGYENASVTVPVEGPVQFVIGGCGYSNQVTVKNAEGKLLATLDSRSAGCDDNVKTEHFVKWTYNSEDTTVLTFNLGSYCPFMSASPCELIPIRTVSYYDVDGKTLIGKEEVEGGSALKYKYSAENVTVAEGSKFRGWFNSTQSTAIKVAEGTSVQENLNLYAKATPVEVATVGTIFKYALNSTAFYADDHELFTSTGTFHDSQHGYGFGSGQDVTIEVGGNAVIVLGLCQYGDPSSIVVTDANGNQVGQAITLPIEKDGTTASVTYQGPATKLKFTFTKGGYLHNIQIYNVESVPVKGESGYYELAANDGASLLLVLAALQNNDRIYLPNGTYDLGEAALTTISAKNVSIIGESMLGTIIRNCPPKENEGIGTTATLLNTSNGLYLQDITLQNALDYYATGSAGRAVCLQDKGSNTICKNVRMLSYQDTYYSNNASKFYWEDSEIHGTVDYLCGDGDVTYNRCLFVNESRERTAGKGDCTVCAPYTSESCKWGYVFMNCAIDTKSATFNFGRSWGGDSKAIYLNTIIYEPSKLAKSRFTASGMNIAAYKFKEYKTVDLSGNVISPASNVMTFTHKSGDKKYETILTDAEAAEYTLQNIYGSWAPQTIAAQVQTTSATMSNGTVTWEAVEGAPAYLVQVNSEAPVLVVGTSYSIEGTITSATVRAANARGGFGDPIHASESTGIQTVKQSAAKGLSFDLTGRKASAKGLCIQNGKVIMNK